MYSFLKPPDYQLFQPQLVVAEGSVVKSAGKTIHISYDHLEPQAVFKVMQFWPGLVRSKGRLG